MTICYVVVEISSCQRVPRALGKFAITFSAISSQQHANLSSKALSVITDCRASWSQKVKCDYLLQLLFKIPQCGLNPHRPEIQACSRRTGRTQLAIFVWHSKQSFNSKANILKISHGLDQFNRKILLVNVKLVAALKYYLAL